MIIRNLVIGGTRGDYDVFAHTPESRAAEREELERQVQQFLSNGGVINHIKPNITSIKEKPLNERRKFTIQSNKVSS